MTELIVSTCGNVVDTAFARVTLITTGPEGIGDALHKLSAGAVAAAAGEVWERVRVVLNQAARDGWTGVQVAVDDMNRFIEERAAELYDDAVAFRRLLHDKLQELMRETVDIVLRSVRSRITVGEGVFVLKSIELETKVVYSASLEASITALCKFLGSGETVVTGTYALADAMPVQQ